MVTRASLGVDGGDGLLQEAHAGLEDLAVGEAHGLERCATEHHVELGVAEDEGVALVDQRDLDLLAERLREHGGELETAEARPQDNDATLHAAELTERQSGIVPCPSVTPLAPAQGCCQVSSKRPHRSPGW